jgi:hypothetical protein
MASFILPAAAACHSRLSPIYVRSIRKLCVIYNQMDLYEGKRRYPREREKKRERERERGAAVLSLGERRREAGQIVPNVPSFFTKEGVFLFLCTWQTRRTGKIGRREEMTSAAGRSTGLRLDCGCAVGLAWSEAEEEAEDLQCQKDVTNVKKNHKRRARVS